MQTYTLVELSAPALSLSKCAKWRPGYRSSALQQTRINPTYNRVRWNARLCPHARHGMVVCSITCCAATDSPLVVVGSVNADLVLVVPRFPASGETLEAYSMSTYPGGKGGNQAAAAARLGCQTLFIGQVGDDANADMLRHSLQDSQVNTAHLQAVDGPSGTAVVLLQHSGENSIVIVGGANTAHWEFSSEADEALRTAAVLLLQREIPDHINLYAAEMAADAKVVLDCGGAEGPISQLLLERVSVLSPNETELERLTGMGAGNEEEAIAAARSLMRGTAVEAVLVKRGDLGSLLISGEDGQDVLHQDAIRIGVVEDTTGAGDCFTGAYAAAVLQGRDQQAALHFASTAAGFSVCHKGAMSSMPWLKEIEQFL